jgi:hypothetical protein
MMARHPNSYHLSMSMGQQVGISQRRLDELPSPVVAFLVNRCRLSLRHALVGCLRELDKEGLVRFEAIAGGMPVVSLGSDAPRSGRSLLAFEEVALARVRTRAGRQVRVPLSVLLSDDGDDYKHWAKQQIDEIGEEAKRAGMAAKSFPRYAWRVVFAAIAVAICAAIVVRVIDPQAAGAVAGAVVAGGVVVLCLPLFFRSWRLTPAGAAAVDSWRRDGGGVPGIAQGLGPVGQRTYAGLNAPGGAPLAAGQAWSSLGGQWHTVRLGLELKPPRWSALPGLRKVLSWTVGASFFAVIAGVTEGWDLNGKLLALAPAALGVFVILVFWLPAFSMRMRLPDNVTFIGEVVRQWHVDGGDYAPDHDWVCVDDGSPTTMKFDVGPATYSQLKVGGLVRVSWSPRRRCLHHIEPAS